MWFTLMIVVVWPCRGSSQPAESSGALPVWRSGQQPAERLQCPAAAHGGGPSRDLEWEPAAGPNSSESHTGSPLQLFFFFFLQLSSEFVCCVIVWIQHFLRLLELLFYLELEIIGIFWFPSKNVTFNIYIYFNLFITMLFKVTCLISLRPLRIVV